MGANRDDTAHVEHRTLFSTPLTDPWKASSALRDAAERHQVHPRDVPAELLAACVTAADLWCLTHQRSNITTSAGLGANASRALAVIIACAALGETPNPAQPQPTSNHIGTQAASLVETHYRWHEQLFTQTALVTSTQLVTHLLSTDPATNTIAAAWQARCEQQQAQDRNKT